MRRRGDSGDRGNKSRRDTDKRGQTGSTMVSGGMTPLFFKGTEGAVLKPFIPSTTRASQKYSN